MPDGDAFPHSDDDPDVTAARDAAQLARRASAIGAEEDVPPPRDPRDDEFLSDPESEESSGRGRPSGDPGA